MVVTHSHKSKNTTHQCGTLVFGTDPKQSVLDTNCKTHDVDNLYVVDASFFPSSAAVNPGLTIVAQAIRVADHIKAAMLTRHRDATQRIRQPFTGPAWKKAAGVMTPFCLNT